MSSSSPTTTMSASTAPKPTSRRWRRLSAAAVASLTTFAVAVGPMADPAAARNRDRMGGLSGAQCLAAVALDYLFFGIDGGCRQNSSGTYTWWSVS